MEKNVFIIPRNGSYQELINTVIPLLNNYRQVLLVGDLGAGKTHFVKQITLAAWKLEQISSPTYSIINEYSLPPDAQYAHLVHMDLYRLEDSEAFMEIGGVDYLDDKDAICMIEWPELAKEWLDEHLELDFATLEDESRKITLSLKTRH